MTAAIAASPTTSRQVTALVPWYGSNRLLAQRVGQELAGWSYVAVPFAGSMCEALYLDAPSILLNDKHTHLINLARCVKARGAELRRTLDAQVFAPDTLAEAKHVCRTHEPDPGNPLFGEPGRKASDPTTLNPADHDAVQWAAAYFYAAWCQRNGIAGTDAEFNEGGPCYRYDDGGGDPVKRYRSAVRQLLHFEALFDRAQFACGDGIALARKIVEGRKKAKTKGGGKDSPARAALYGDPPFPGAGDRYTHPFTPQQHAELAGVLGEAPPDLCRVVVRYYDHDWVRELYPEGDRWTWIRQDGRDQHNADDKPEVLILNGPSQQEAK